MIRHSNTVRPGSRRPALFAVCALTLALAACSDGGSDSPATAPPTLGGGGGDDVADTPLADTSTADGDNPFADGDPFGGGDEGVETDFETDFETDEGTDIGDTDFERPSDDDIFDGGDDEPTFEFDCSGDTIIAGPGDTVTCDGTVYEIDEDGQPIVVGGGGGSGPVDTGGGAPSGDLAASLTNTFISEDDFDIWACEVEALDPTIFLLLGEGGIGVFSFVEGEDVLTSELGWTTQGTDTLFLDLVEDGTQEEISQISFSSDGEAWSGFGSSVGAIDCELFLFEG